MNCEKPRVGINYRSDIADDILNNINHFDFIEINLERFFHKVSDEKLFKILELLPCVLHGLTLSLGDEGNIDKNYLLKMLEVLQKIPCEWLSEHLATTCVSGIEIRNLMPVPFTEEVANKMIEKINQIMSVTSTPFIVENITYYYPMPGSTMTELEFVTYILSRTKCGMLLDLNNLFCNSENHNYDAYDYIDSLPKDKIIEIHLAGGKRMYNMEIDTHSTKISKSVYDLLSYCAKDINFKGVILERDSGSNNFNELLAEVDTIRTLISKEKNR